MGVSHRKPPVESIQLDMNEIHNRKDCAREPLVHESSPDRILIEDMFGNILD